MFWPVLSLILVLSSCCLAAIGQQNDSPKLWAVLVAGSNEWFNYRHQADVCHAYHILHRHGIPDDRIVVMMYDDLANNTQNPTPGIVINHLNGSDVYRGVPHDYIGEDVTPHNFLKVLLGVNPGVGSGKVINSGPNDHIFVNLVDHGAEGLFAFPNEILTTKQLIDAINDLYEQSRYDKLVFYVEACESGSLFKEVLKANMNVYATTASDFNESSYACYYDESRETYLGDLYSVNWMEDSDKENIEKESILKQFLIVKSETNMSHVQEYGDLTISKMPVGQFQGRRQATPIVLPKVKKESVSSWDVPVSVLSKQIAKQNDYFLKQEYQEQLDEILAKRTAYSTWIRKFVKAIAGLRASEVLQQRLPLKALECHHRLAQYFHNRCINLGKNWFALKYAYVLTNFCEIGLNENTVIQKMKRFCYEHPINKLPVI